MVERYLGLISGTSADGVEAALAEFDSGRFVRIVSRLRLPYPQDLQRALLGVSIGESSLTLRAYAELDDRVGACFADAANALVDSTGLASREIRALGSHGQTLFHDGPRSLTVQIGNPNVIAARTGIDTIADFRRADLALGGQGAPLVPAFHHALFADPSEPRVVVNLGGIANVTLLPNLDPDRVIGFDTGPANGLLDEWVQRHLGRPYDEDGAIAAAGCIDSGSLATLLSDPYFQKPPPKSTGRDYFRLARACERAPPLAGLAASDALATLSELTARTVADAIAGHLPSAVRVLVCGGGARNRHLMHRLGALLPNRQVDTTDAFGLDAEVVEAAAFAWLAMRYCQGQPGNFPRVTGASRPAVLGGRYPARTT